MGMVFRISVNVLPLLVISVCHLSATSVPDVKLAANLNSDGYRSLKAGNFEAAIAAFTQAIEVAPEMAKAHWNLACAISLSMDAIPLNEISTRKEKAYKAIRAAIGIEPNRRSKMVSDMDLYNLFPYTDYWLAGGYSALESEALTAVYSEGEWLGYVRDQARVPPGFSENLYHNIFINPKDYISRIAILFVIVYHQHAPFVNGNDDLEDEIVKQFQAIIQINRNDGYERLFRTGIMGRIRYEPFFTESKLDEDLEKHVKEFHLKKRVVRLSTMGLEFEINRAYVFTPAEKYDGVNHYAKPCQLVGTADDITEEEGEPGSGTPVGMEITVCPEIPGAPIGVLNYIGDDEKIEQRSSLVSVSGVEAKKMSWIMPGLEMSTQYLTEIYVPYEGQCLVLSFTYLTSYYDLPNEKARNEDHLSKEKFISDILKSFQFH